MFHKLGNKVLFHNLYWVGSLLMSIMIIASVLVGVVSTFGEGEKVVFMQVPAVISAGVQANYADGVAEYVFPGISLGIVDDILHDDEINNLDQMSVGVRIANVVDSLQQPIPTAVVQVEVNSENMPTPTNNENQIITIVTTNTNQTPIISETSTQNPGLTLIPVTGTSTAVQTPSSTPRLTISPTMPFIPSITSSFTPTIIFTPTPTITFTSTSSFTPTWTYTFTRTPTITNTRTPTFTLTPSWTYTQTPSLTSTFTPSQTYTPTLTNTRTPTFTLTPSLTYSQTPSLTSTFSPSQTFTPTLTFTITRSPTSTPTLIPTLLPTTTIVCNEYSDGVLVNYMVPADASIDVPLDVNPLIVFNQSMDLSTITYGDTSHIVICQKTTDNSNACQNGTEVGAYLEIKSVNYQNDWVIVHPFEDLEKGILYTMFAGNQIKSHLDCSSYARPLGGRDQSNFITVNE